MVDGRDPGGGDDQPIVVGIGTSAGGLAALRELFRLIPSDSGMAYVVVMHLAPDQKSHLADLLQPHVRMPVLQVTETTALSPDHVYVIPPNRNLNTIDTHLRLTPLEAQRSERAPIDHFMATLAETHDSNAIGIILTGTGSDGTVGLGVIKERGGLTIAQDPDEAEYDGMPRNAVASGAVDLVLPIEAMPEHIARFVRTAPRLHIPEHDDDLDHQSRALLQRVLALVLTRTGNDLSGYKRSTIMRRIRRRMQLRELESLDGYVRLLRDESIEVERLFEDLLISVTSFFRDTEVFDELERNVIPALFEGKAAPGDSVRAWTVGCSTGEEAYSIAMLLLERAATLNRPPTLQLFASDLGEHSLRHAREGLYPSAIESDVSPERLRRFFAKENGGYRIRQEVREIVVFAPHNLLRDPPFSHIDLVTCRNLLIYLQRDVQRDVVSLFHYALNSGGYLLLGTSETVDQSELFTVREKRLCLYQRRDVRGAEPRLPVFSPAATRLTERQHWTRPGSGDLAAGALHERMVEQYAPPSVLIDPDHRIVHYSALAGRYLVHSGGEPTQDVFRLLRDELRFELRTALHAARNEGGPTHSHPVETTLDGHPATVVMRVRPATDEQLTGYVLVIFDEIETHEPTTPSEGTAETLTHIERELDVTRQRLQAVIEEYETSREEMRASNEELQSTNEELRSTMEELETSKEELQSMNEELTTLNQENRHKVEELSQLSSDLQNLLSATEIATIFLDRELRIVRFTPPVGDIFNIRPSDRGRPLSDLTHRLGDGDLQHEAQRVLERLIPAEREIERSDGSWLLTRIMPYRSADDRIEGVVITFVDISERRRSEEAVQRLNDELEGTVTERTTEARNIAHRFRALVEASTQIVWDADEHGRMTQVSPAWRALTGASESDWRTVGWIGSVHAADRAHADRAWRQALRDRRPISLEVRIADVGSGGWRWVTVTAVPVEPDGDTAPGWIGTIADIEQRKQAETQLRTMASEVTLAEQRERSRIGQVLHDDLQQLLHGLQMRIGLVRDQAQGVPLEALAELGEASAWLERAIDMTRELSVELSPPISETGDLEETLRWLGDRMRQLHGLDVELHVPAGLAVRNRDVQLLLYQAARELLFNVAKHADVGAARVEVSQGEGVLLMAVRDDGHGFDLSIAQPLSAGSGLLRIRNRLRVVGGQLAIESSPGAGTRATVQVPLELIATEDDQDASAP